MSTGRERRRKNRNQRVSFSGLRLSYQEQSGLQQIVPAVLLDLTEEGCGLEVEADVPIDIPVTVLGDLTNQGGGREVQVRGRLAWSQPSSDWTWRCGVEFEAPIQLGKDKARPRRDQPIPEDAEDYYEILQLSSNADQETVGRVYRILAARYHPDNRETGSTEAFRRIHNAYLTLNDPVRRAAYDAEHQARKKLRWKIFDQPKSAQGMHAERAKRRGILQLLYTKRAASPEQPGVSIIELEDMLGVPREHLDFSLWFLRECGLVTRTDSGKLSITVKGVLEAENDYGPEEVEHREDHLLVAPNGRY